MYSISKDQLIAELRAEGISNEAMLAAMAHVPREAFIDMSYAESAYENRPLPIACQQTISQPYIVARMTSLLLDGANTLEKVLEIGTGSGYQAAILARLVKQVYSVERIEKLYQQSRARLAALKITNVEVNLSDGALGLAEHAPYDGIIVTACCREVSKNWLSQLKVGGRLVLPLQMGGQQVLYRITRHEKYFEEEAFEPVNFVPLLSGVEKDKEI